MRKNILLAFFLFAPLSVLGREYRDTLVTSTGDTFIVPYQVTVDKDIVTVSIRPAIKRMGQSLSRKYRKPEELTLVFFDRNGSYQDAVFTGDVKPEAFMVPAQASYSASQDGFFILNDNPELQFQLQDGRSEFSLSIPFFLTHHPNLGKYSLIARCGQLLVKANNPEANDRSQRNPIRKESVITSTIEVETDNTDMTKVLDCINSINARLPFEDRLPFSESLDGDVRLLREWKYTVKDATLKEKVEDTLNEYESLKRKLQDQEVAAQNAARMKAEEEQRLAAAAAQSREEAAEVARKQDEEKQQKRNIWMIIGGLFTAAGAFVGNQVMQSRRAAKSQQNIMAMQQSMAQQAGNAVKMKAQTAVKSKTTQIVGQVKSQVTDAVRQNIGKSMGKEGGMQARIGKKKNITI